MPSIHIREAHNLGLATAKQRVEKLAGQLNERLGVTHTWSGDTLEFERSGATGTILVEQNAVTVDVKLGIMLAAFKGEVEKQLKGFLEEHLK